MKVVFVSFPTAGTVVDGMLSSTFLKYLAQLHKDNTDVVFLAPMVQQYPISQFLNVPATWNQWNQMCVELISRSDEVLVLKFAGWEDSVGVAGEIQTAKAFSKPLRFQDIPQATLEAFDGECCFIKGALSKERKTK